VIAVSVRPIVDPTPIPGKVDQSINHIELGVKAVTRELTLENEVFVGVLTDVTMF